MSGGSLDYVHQRVQDVALQIGGHSAVHAAFAKHLLLVAKALHDVEWVLSADYATGDDIPAIKAVVTPEAILEEAVARADAARLELEKALEEARAHRR